MGKSLIILGFVFALAACGESSAKFNASESDKVKAAFDSAFIADFRKSFVEEGVKSCMESANQGEKSRQYCECAMTTLEKGLSDDDVFALSTDNLKDMPQRMVKAMKSCK